MVNNSRSQQIRVKIFGSHSGIFILKHHIEDQECVHLQITENHPNDGFAHWVSPFSFKKTSKGSQCRARMKCNHATGQLGYYVFHSPRLCVKASFSQFNSHYDNTAAAHLSLGPYTGVKKERTKGLRSILVSSDLFKISPEASPGNFCLNLTAGIGLLLHFQLQKSGKVDTFDYAQSPQTKRGIFQ